MGRWSEFRETLERGEIRIPEASLEDLGFCRRERYNLLREVNTILLRMRRWYFHSGLAVNPPREDN